jgi:hypothetical protein
MSGACSPLAISSRAVASKCTAHSYGSTGCPPHAYACSLVKVALNCREPLETALTGGAQSSGSSCPYAGSIAVTPYLSRMATASASRASCSP